MTARERQRHPQCTTVRNMIVGCDIPRELIERAEHSPSDRAQVAAALKRCADDVVAPLPDGRS